MSFKHVIRKIYLLRGEKRSKKVRTKYKAATNLLKANNIVAFRYFIPVKSLSYPIEQF